jgi:ribosomal protein S18 acetylase RimI-like enzyme
MKWAGSSGAREAWLQVEADNEPAYRLYTSLGFSEVYRYHYRQPPEK